MMAGLKGHFFQRHDAIEPLGDTANVVWADGDSNADVQYS